MPTAIVLPSCCWRATLNSFTKGAFRSSLIGLGVAAHPDLVGQDELGSVPLELVVARLLGDAGVDRVGDVLHEELVVLAVRGGGERLAVAEDVVDRGQARREVRRVDDGVPDVALGGLVVHAEAQVEEEVLSDLELIESVEAPDLPGRDGRLRVDEVEPQVARGESRLPGDRVEVGDDEFLVVRVDEGGDRLQALVVDAGLELVRVAEELLVEVDRQVRLLARALDEALERGAVVDEAVVQVDVRRPAALEGADGDVAVLLRVERLGGDVGAEDAGPPARPRADAAVAVVLALQGQRFTLGGAAPVVDDEALDRVAVDRSGQEVRGRRLDRELRVVEIDAQGLLDSSRRCRPRWSTRSVSG